MEQPAPSHRRSRAASPGRLLRRGWRIGAARVDGIADFNGLHSRKHDEEVQLYAFDVLMSAGDDLRPLPLHLRKNQLAKMLRRRVDGIILNDFEQGEIGPELLRHACLMGLEGLVSKHKDQPYRAGRSKHWIKVKNRTSPAMNRPEGMF
jgi:bifunctional non-homologous end joining protein LigD